jgi:fluoroacetyl-CoA thioesterase
MSFAIQIGASKERTVNIDSNQTTSFLWEGENVLSTPSMISELEETCRVLLKEQFITDVEWDSVGTLVNVRHLASTPVGAQVFFKAEVISVEGRRVRFRVEAADNIEKIGDGTHERSIIHIPKFRARIQGKQKQLEVHEKSDKL